MRCYRFFCRIRPKHQRRRRLIWLAMVGFVLCFLYYNELILTEPRQRRIIPVVEQGRKPMAIQAKMPELLDNDYPSDLDLSPDLAPAVLHYIWCGDKVFEFRHYLALKSAHRAVKPEKVFFHYKKLPQDDEQGYYQWFNEIVTEIDHILPRQLNQSMCPDSGTAERYLLVLDLLEKNGGIYVPEDSIWVDFPVHLRSYPIVSGVLPVSPAVFRDGIIVAKKQAFTKPTSSDEMLITLTLGKHEHGELKPCANQNVYNSDVNGHIICVAIREELFPKDIWEADTQFGMLARVVAYGTPRIRHRQSQKNAMPKIAHYACIDCNLNFFSYLSMLSAIFVAGLNKVYLHGVQSPSGPWWARLVKDPRFVFVYREYPETIYDKAVMSSELALAIMRSGILLKYGGVYQDQNVLWTRRIPESHFAYESVVSPHWHQYGQWPDSVNHGTIMSKRNSRYVIKVREVMQKKKENPHWFNDQYLSYKVIERQPDIIKLDRHLQVICLNHNCHPTWQPNYKSGLMQNRPGGSFSWQNDTMSIYWVDTFPELNPDIVKYTSGMIVEVIRYILLSAEVDINKL